jgi:hypothetical protein
LKDSSQSDYNIIEWPLFQVMSLNYLDGFDQLTRLRVSSTDTLVALADKTMILDWHDLKWSDATSDALAAL